MKNSHAFSLKITSSLYFPYLLFLLFRCRLICIVVVFGCACCLLLFALFVIRVHPFVIGYLCLFLRVQGVCVVFVLLYCVCFGGWLFLTRSNVVI